MHLFPVLESNIWPLQRIAVCPGDLFHVEWFLDPPHALMLRINNFIRAFSLLQNDVVDIGAHGLRRLVVVEWLSMLHWGWWSFGCCEGVEVGWPRCSCLPEVMGGFGFCGCGAKQEINGPFCPSLSAFILNIFKYFRNREN